MQPPENGLRGDKMSMLVFCVVMSCVVVCTHQRSGEAFCLRLQPWGWRQYVPPKRWYVPRNSDGDSAQKTNNGLFTAVITSRTYDEYDDDDDDDKPNVVVEWLTLLLRIWEGSHSNLGTETDYLDWVFSLFSSLPPARQMPEEYLILGHGRFLQLPSQFIIHLLSLHSTLYSQRYWKSAVK
jgi:hypothetical protein